jgi:hypothetical protein
MFNRLYTEGFNEIVPLTTAPPVGYYQEVGMFHPHDETMYYYVDLLIPSSGQPTGYETKDIVVTCDECGQNLLGRQVCNRDKWHELVAEQLSQTCDYCCDDWLPSDKQQDWRDRSDLASSNHKIWHTVADWLLT